MKPENHAIRQLEKQIDAAPPEVAEQIKRVIQALTECIKNSRDPEALAMCKRGLAAELAELEKLRGQP